MIVLEELKEALLKVPPVAIVISPFTVSVRAVVASYCKIPEVPCPIVNLLRTGVLMSTVTVAPFAIITSSPAAGGTPPTQVLAALHKPPVVVDVITEGTGVAADQE